MKVQSNIKVHQSTNNINFQRNPAGQGSRGGGERAMKVVVTGGGGYVGYHVGWAIARGGHEVVLLDVAAPDPEWATTAPEALHDALPDGGSWELKPGSAQTKQKGKP